MARIVRIVHLFSVRRVLSVRPELISGEGKQCSGLRHLCAELCRSGGSLCFRLRPGHWLRRLQWRMLRIYIRDIFVFASFTALSFVDIKELTNSNIVEVNGEKWILSKRYKTKVPFQVKLLDTPLQIIERYRPCQEDNLIFPNLNYWSICKSLKKGMKECG